MFCPDPRRLAGRLRRLAPPPAEPRNAQTQLVHEQVAVHMTGRSQRALVKFT
jgi:hypothetical protein